MSDKSCDILAEYLRSIMHDEKIVAPDIDSLEEPFRELGKELKNLQTSVEEMLEYSSELARGNLSARKPSKDNKLCANLIDMNNSFDRITWQAKQVAAGDLSQTIPKQSEFSEAFNSVTRQLRDRETRLLRESEELRRHSEEISIYNELLVKMTANRAELILVVDSLTREIVYCNKCADQLAEVAFSVCSKCNNGVLVEEILSWDSNKEEIWEMHPEHHKYYRVNSYPVDWQGRNSYVHIITDISESMREKKYLSDKAYIDPVTSVNNRFFFEEYMDMVISEQKVVTLGYLDLDGLKYVNDNFGHTEGDAYIKSFAALIRKNFRRGDVFARIGGDEFCVVLEGRKREFVLKKLESIRDMLTEDHSKEYPMSFSYGVHEIDSSEEGISLKNIMHEADTRMYEYKRANKKARE